MKKCWDLLAVAGVCAAGLSAVLPATAAADTVNVTQHHNNPSRDGLYIDPAFTLAAAANVTRDLSFTGTIVGNVYAQPLYIENGPGGVAMVIAVTESNNVYALNAATGAIIWQRNVGTPVTSGLPCGNINPLGITGTPIVDLASRALFFDAEVSGIGHQVFSLNVDTGTTNIGWPVTVSTVVPGFDSDRSQSERAALGLLGNIVYVPYGGRFGDCGTYHGRLVGVQINSPASVMAWATTVAEAGVWGPGGVASDGTNLFVTTGNGNTGAGTWGGSEAVIRLLPGPIFSGSTTDYWAPTNWHSLDLGDTDLGGSGAILVDVPGATPSALMVALGKDGNAYLLNRSNLGGVSAPVAQSSVNSGSIIQAAATYRTALSTYVVFRGNSTTTTAFRITATNPPTIATGWSVTGQNGRSSPFVTSTDGTNNMIVWVVGSGGDQKLHGYNGDTGAVVYNGGGTNEIMTGTRGYNANAIAARGRVYVAADNKVYAFNVPASSTPTPTPTPSPTPTPTATATATATATPVTTPTPTPTPVVVAMVSLPTATIDTTVTNFTQPVVTSTINAGDNLIGFQGDFTYDETVVTFQNPPVSSAGLTASNWNVTGAVQPGGGPIRTLRVSAFSNDFTPLSGSGTLYNLNMTRVSSTPGASTALTWAAPPNNFIFIDADLNIYAPGSTPPGSITIQPATINISGTVTYCSNPSVPPVPNVTLTLTGSASGSTLSDGSGNYTFSSLASGGSYTVTPTKTALAPGSPGINTIDVVATQRQFLNLGTPLTGCPLTAADVNGDSSVNTIDVVAIQRFFLSQTTGIANVGKYQFNPVNRSYPGVVTNQTGQNYDALVFGDVASGFVH